MADSTCLPRHAGELLRAVVDILRVESQLEAANKRALRRWADTGKRPTKTEALQRLARDVAGGALPLARFPRVFGLDRDVAIDAIGDGLVRALVIFDEPERRSDWIWSLGSTIALIMARSGVRALKRHGNGSVATAPNWFFAGKRPNRRRPGIDVVRPATERLRERLDAELKDDGDGRLRKTIDAMAAGSQPHHATLDEVATLAADDTFPYHWAAEEIMVRFGVDQFVAALVTSKLDSMADVLAAAPPRMREDDWFADALRGMFFDERMVAMIRGREPGVVQDRTTT